MAIRGSLREASLPDVLQLLALGRKTGCLSVTYRNNFGSIYFDDGLISFASVINRRDRLGDLLVKRGTLTAAQLDEAIAEQGRHRNLRLGDILVQQGLLSRSALHEYIRVQIEEAVFYLFTWTEGTFNFEPDLRPEAQDFLVAIRPDALLLEGARRVDEWSLIEKKIPSFDIVFDVDRHRLAESGLELTPAQEAVVVLLDGRRSVQDVIHESGLVEFEVGKALYGLAAAGYLHRIGATRPSGEFVIESRGEEHRELGLAFYKSGMYDEAVRELRRASELRPDDASAAFFAGLALAKLGRWIEAEEALRQAVASPQAPGAAFHNLAYVLERLRRFDEARSALAAAEARGLARDPRTRTSHAILALRTGDVAAADAAFDDARACFEGARPTPAWASGAALAAALRGDLDRARAVIEEALEGFTHPSSAVLMNNLAVVYERMGRHDDARDAAERGRRINPGLPQLHKNLGDALRAEGRDEDALAAYARAVELEPALGPDVYVQVGAIHAARSAVAEATRAWERALALDPAHETARANLDAARGGAPPDAGRTP